MIRRFIFGLTVAASGLLLGGCDRNRVFEENTDLKDYVWRIEDRPTFSFPITDTAARYTVYLNVRNTTSYQFYNLYVKLTLTGPDGSIVNQKLHRVILLDPQTGEPLGDGTGDIFDHQFVALPHMRFSKVGTYQVVTEQYMRVSVLPDIMAIGVRVERDAPAAAAAK
jgi:gliding motility-associated lipoprotein GldH